MRKNGSVTVFFVLLLVLLASVLFAFLEAARVSCLKAEAHLCTGQAADAVRASYQPELWKDYHLLFWQQSGTDVDRFADLYQLQKDMVEKNQAVNVSHNNFFFLPVHSRAITVEQYQLATDSGGLASKSGGGVGKKDDCRRQYRSGMEGGYKCRNRTVGTKRHQAGTGSGRCPGTIWQ